MNASTSSFLFPLYSERKSVFQNEKSFIKDNRIEYRRSDGIRMGFDPYAPGIAETYGSPGETDPDGFNPYKKKAGPGIYGGNVKRDENGNMIMGRQYQDHNSRPGPVYDGNGYSLMSRAIHEGEHKVLELLKASPDLKNEISTGGARPLHTCAMSRKGKGSTQILIDAGADIHALDTYHYNALHRMASNDFDIEGVALVRAGLDPNFIPEGADLSPIGVARISRAKKFLAAMKLLDHYDA